MSVVGMFERPFALDEGVGFSTRTNEPKLGRMELLAGEMAYVPTSQIASCSRVSWALP
jgi:hypothetical protein